MEIRAYYEGYLDEAMDTMGNMMDHAMNACGMDGDDFFHMFLASGTAGQFERGNPRYLAGMTGAEIVREIVLREKGIELNEPEEYDLDKSPEYWCGWILAYYQWRTCRSFRRIYQTASIDEILCMYPTHHEADEEHFVDTMELLYQRRHTRTYVSQKMENLGISREDLARQAKIPSALISELEKSFTRIADVDAGSLFRISKVLGCTMEDLMEYPCP